MKLWLDDYRPPPAPDWAWARTVDEAVSVIKLNWISEASLDYNLDGETGYTVLLWLETYEGRRPEKVVCHSTSKAARIEMEKLITKIYQV